MPQIVVFTILTTASLDCSRFGLGRSSTKVDPGPWYTTGGQALPDTLNSVRPVWTEIDVGILVLRVLMQACDDQTLIRFNRPTMAWANSLVDAVPPRSPVRTLSSFSV